MRNRIALMLSLMLLSAAGPVLADCPPAGTDAGSLQLLRQQEFALADDGLRDTLAMGLLDCLGDPDPALRDGIAYEGVTVWLRAGQLSEALRGQMRDRLYVLLDADDPEGFRQPFAALLLAEVARTDRLQPWMSGKERATMVGHAVTYLASVRDYRGFDDAQGWRHGVAHGADWLLQLALNEQVDRTQAESMLAAIASQVAPESAHAYVYGEPGRLARPVVYLAHRGLLDQAQWQAWFAALPPRLGEPAQAYADSAWLARRHDLMAFLMSVYLEADQSGDAQIQALKPAVVAALKTIP
ncbi:DUF2785 domain-containing protein [Pseudoxanthomonas wuyuanensis]|uniref:DUF2785 domain-containing protein n=1 Tax=Pseudoxanthomonas wuyuanensis TaxID=1073196 RepID=A0A286DDY0_9GAMM|nr:DUF2785 domain-containing protein [Pseudoxanthomonas wuyuanensis]SOD56868.1 Protein of unknown function [Pseudoxanthomonas wuyuanensis]